MSLLNMYHSLPPSGRTVVASVRGLQLRLRRYGPETDQLVDEAIERDAWKSGRWRLWQEAAVAALLHRAAKSVPYYREQWSARRRKGDRSSCEVLENWPVLEKDAVRSNPEAFVADDSRAKKLYRDSTSGTSGKPIQILSSVKTLRAWYALYEARCRRWNGASREEHWAMLGGQLVVPVSRVKPPFWVWNAGLKQLYMSSAHMSADAMPAYRAALVEFGIRHIVGYSSALSTLARGIAEHPGAPLSIGVAITNAEPVFPEQRRTIEEAFGCPVRETYGMAEMVAAASECEHGELHSWPEAGVIESVLPDGSAAAATSGDLVCTGLLNTDMPLIRYRTGDRGKAPRSDGRCGCGRGLPVLPRIEGRDNDSLLTADGRRVYWLNPVLYGLRVCEAQIVQTAVGNVVVRYVPDGDALDGDSLKAIRERLEQRLGRVQVRVEAVPQIERSANGKFRAVVCSIPFENARGTATSE